MQRPTKFEIAGLFGNRDISIQIEGDAIILVGPNGIGKSCVTNIFYFFISRQWGRLAEYEFNEVAVWFGEEEVRATRAEVLNLSQFDRILVEYPTNSRTRMTIEKMREHGLLESMLDPKSKHNLKEYAEILDTSPDEAKSMRFIVRRTLASLTEREVFSPPKTDIENQLKQHHKGRILYLPTYRRIEKDLREVLPELSERIRTSSRIADLQNRYSHSADHYIDLVNFGMEDVRTNIESRTQSLRDYSLAQLNNLSSLYLKDVINGTADQYTTSEITELDSNSLETILGRVSEEILSKSEKSRLRTKILNMREKEQGEVETNDRYLAHYFTRLMSASADISSQEEKITSFVNVCNAYLNPSKTLRYDNTKFTVGIFGDHGQPIDLSLLSSGEKQVVSLFSHLYLDDTQDQIVIIDEPELSLSVPWQKRLLTDILASKRCSFVFSVTHSPFIYQNELRPYAIDLRLKTITNNGEE